ncbi:multidrug resistance-associated ABC transporter [Cylindrobasidium torrendii FP15055 ss-10]|uniref:Multidrug resistance-associated ABC transporter n=1 Tax=Cylindrobasidium torrendii FP15055 ss-10 TaxID=1314674 RepID=A0A0D7AYK3_9AGAR|nr:multidrug resistance-associated ABC transporter [Cylindrobasidium torrendii FP15055 ss-10]
MEAFEKEIVIALGACGVASIATFVLTRPREAGVQLPEDDTVGHDPFDVARPIDFEEGTHIDEEAFWRRVGFRKTATASALAIALLSEAARLVSALADALPQETIVICVGRVVFAAYLFALAIRAIRQSTIHPHYESIMHITVLSLATVLVLLIAALVPSTPTLPLRWSQPVAFAFYALAGFVAMHTPTAPRMHFNPEDIYSPKAIKSVTNYHNVSGATGASPWESMWFTYTNEVMILSNTADSVEVADLPIVPVTMRAVLNYTAFRKTLQATQSGFWIFRPGSGRNLAYSLLRLNIGLFIAEILLAVANAIFIFIPPLFLQKFIQYLEADRERTDTRWGWAFAVGLFSSKFAGYMINNQLWSFSTVTLKNKISLQLTSAIFAKTLVRKDVASSGSTNKDSDTDLNKAEDAFSSKAQVLTLMFSDTDRIAMITKHIYNLTDSPTVIIFATLFLYKLLGVSCFFGIGVACLFLPLNHFAGSVVVGAQERLMSARDKRVALMNELLGAIRMLKFMAWERSFATKVVEIREQELKHQRMNYVIEVLWKSLWYASHTLQNCYSISPRIASPILVTLTSFWHFTLVREQVLTPSIAFTSIVVFNHLKHSLNALPEIFIPLLQARRKVAVSVRRIEKYLDSAEVEHSIRPGVQPETVALQSCTVAWPHTSTSLPQTQRRKPFTLQDLNIEFPKGGLSLVCGKLGSGKTLLLHALLGEADVLSGKILCPRSPPDALANLIPCKASKQWIVQDICAYVPQTSWLRNASIKDNILFSLPYDENRYQKTLEACALNADLALLEDGDDSEVGEKGINLSGGQRARISLARAIYSRASVLFLDDVLSAVDAHTAHHLYHRCLKGELMFERTIILVSHHVQLCVSGAQYVVALDNGVLKFAGDREAFMASEIKHVLLQTAYADDDVTEVIQPGTEGMSLDKVPESMATVAVKRAPRRVIEDEARQVGHVDRDVWLTYVLACGRWLFWPFFCIIFVIGALMAVAETGWVKHWSDAGSNQADEEAHPPIHYIRIYALVCFSGLIVNTIRWGILYAGSIQASRTLHARLLESILFAGLRFHTTTSRGSLLNRFAKDMEVLDSELGDTGGNTVIFSLSFVTSLVTLCVVGGWQFIIPLVCLVGLYYDSGYSTARMYGQVSRDLRRLSSITRSPQYAIVDETITGVPVIRAFGASSNILRDMLRIVDTNANPSNWMWAVNRWMTIRLDVISCSAIALVAIYAIFLPRLDASLVGFALTFADLLPDDVLSLVRTFVGLEQSMVALERIKEYSELPREPPEFMEPRPPKLWPQAGKIEVKDLAIRYAPDLPNVLHGLTFDIKPGEKVGILGRTGSGKSTIAMSFFRFVEPTEGSIAIDGLDISSIGLTDLRSRLTIIPQDPTILSGTLRSTLDVFDEYQDAEIFEALRRVHLIPSGDADQSVEDFASNVFRNLDSPISENGDNFSAGEKQLLCMARAILKRSRVVIMDEATSSIDNGMDQLIGKTIRDEFSKSTILTIAHRLRTVIDFDRIMVLENGRIVEFDSPSILLQNEQSRFHGLCSATGKEEFLALKSLAALTRR